MTKASDNIYPSMLYAEGTTPSSPSSGQQRLFVRSSDHVLCMVNSSGTVTPLSGSLTNPMGTAGSMIVGGTAGAPTELLAGTAGYPLVGGGAGVASAYAIAGKAHYCALYSAVTTTLSTGTNTLMAMASELGDSDAYHFTSAANLTGTVTKAASSAAIVGSSTLFTSELAVNQVISIPGTAAEIGVVKTITDNTHLTLWQTMANSASGQTATRKNEYLAIPAGFGGIYLLRAGTQYVVGTVVGASSVITADILVNGSSIARDEKSNLGASSNTYLTAVSEPYHLNDGDYVAYQAFSNTGSNSTLGSTGTPDQACARLSAVLIGT